MADKTLRTPENTPGPFYVDDSCIDCDVCRTTAPEFFKREEDEGYSIVYRQPTNDEEQAAAMKGLHSCPTDSIGCDGDIPSVAVIPTLSSLSS